MKIRTLAALFSLLASFAAVAAEPPLNIIFLLADDLRADVLGCAGNRVVQTPNIDRLARRGTMFRQAFVTTSICMTSRASIFSGQYAARHGIYDFKTPLAAAQWSNTYPALLRAAGYRTGFIGKFGVGNVMPTNAFDYWDGFPGQGRYFDPKHPVHLTHRMGDSALRFLEANDARPFCLSISFKAPHAQDGAPREFPPDPQDESLYVAEAIRPGVNHTAEAFERLPAFVRNSEGHTRWLRRFATPEMRERTTKDYYRLVTGIDREVGRIMERLEGAGLTSRTLIVFTSDNGFFLGERGMSDKFLAYEESMRVPLIVFDPRNPSRGRGQRRDQMVLNIDIAPTLLEYAGVPIPSSMQGRSLRGLIEDRAVRNWRQDWFYEQHYTHQGKIPACEAVRGERWKYIRYPGVAPAVEELYDLRRDESETRNLAGDSRHAARLKELRTRWEELRARVR